jgi:hypothetical protein
LLVPAFDDGLRLGARGSIGDLPLGIGGNVQAPASERPCGSIRGIEPSIQTMRVVSIREADRPAKDLDERFQDAAPDPVRVRTGLWTP